MAKSRRVWITVIYAGKDISEDISNDVLEFTYVDKTADEADEISITVHDREGKWHNEWYPKAHSANSNKSSDYSKIAKALQQGTSSVELQRLIDEADLTSEQGATLQRVTVSSGWTQYVQQHPQYKGEGGKELLIMDIKAGVVK